MLFSAIEVACGERGDPSKLYDTTGVDIRPKTPECIANNLSNGSGKVSEHYLLCYA
jgi:hypothetical protein